METNQEQKMYKRQGERGNVLIYVLIAVALFAALSMTLGRQTDTSEASGLSDDRATLYATQMIDYAAQVKSALDQMQFQNIKIDDMDFTLPTDSAFNTEPPKNIYKVYHPSGGGIIPSANIPPEIKKQIYDTYPTGWYLGRFSNVEWTPTTGQDIILTLYQISKPLCEKINLAITGSADIPSINGDMGDFLVDTNINSDLDNASCTACVDKASLCVSNGTISAYSFYSIVAAQ